MERGFVLGWQTIVSADRSVATTTYRLREPDKVQRRKNASSAADLQKLVSVIERSRFFDLPRDMSADGNDLPSYSIEVTKGGKTHKVRVYGPAFVSDKRALRRFRDVWAAATGKSPFRRENEELSHLNANI